MSKIAHLVTNSKLKGSAVYTYAFNLPAVTTCPGAGICEAYCFASSEQKRYPSAKAFRERNRITSTQRDFVDVITGELATLADLHGRRGTLFAIRIHASGDFYNSVYARKWMVIAENNPLVQFYAYTKSIAIWKKLQRIHVMPRNLTVIYSLGSNQDKLIDLDSDRHARIFNTEREALNAGYTLASEDDTAAWASTNHRIGLVIFGATKKFKDLTKVISQSADKGYITTQEKAS